MGVSFSVGFVDEDVVAQRRAWHPEARCGGSTRYEGLADAGFAVMHVLMAPLLPGITDTDESIEATVAAIAASGAAGISPISLHLRPRRSRVVTRRGSGEPIPSWWTGTGRVCRERLSPAKGIPARASAGVADGCPPTRHRPRPDDPSYRAIERHTTQKPLLLPTAEQLTLL